MATTTKPRLSYRGQAFAAADTHNVTLAVDDTQPGLTGTATAPAGFVFTASSTHTISFAYDGKREAAWPKLAKLMKAGTSPCTCTACTLALAVADPAPAGLVSATGILTGLADAVIGTLTARQQTGYKRTSRPYGPYLAADVRADYHKGWALAGAKQSIPADASTALQAGFWDRKASAAPWSSLAA